MRRIVLKWIAPGVVTVLLGTAVTVLTTGANMASDLSQRSAEAMKAGGFGWADVNFDTRKAILSGTASNGDEIADAVAHLRSMHGVEAVIASAKLAPLAKPYHFAATVKDGKVTLAGGVPDIAMRPVLVAEVGAAADDLRLMSGAPDRARWRAAAEFALKRAAELEEGSVDLTDLRLSITGRAKSANDFDSLQLALASGVPQGLSIGDVSVRPAAVSPYLLTAKFDGKSLALSGNVPSEAVVAQLRSVAPKGVNVSTGLALASGEPERFAEHAAILVASLTRLEQGRASIDGDRITLSGAPANATVAQTVVDALHPTGAIVTLDPPRVADYVFSADRADGSIILDGYVPDEATRNRLAAHAGVNVAGLELGRGEPDRFDSAVDFGLAALDRMSKGRFALEATDLTLQGVAATAADYRGLTKTIADGAPQGLVLKLAQVSPPAVSPYLWSAEKAKDGSIALGGYVPSQDVRDTLVEGIAKVSGDTTSFAGGEPDGFVANAVAALDVLGDLDSGKVAFDGSSWSVTGAVDSADKAASASAAFEASPLKAAGATYAVTAPTPPAAAASAPAASATATPAAPTPTASASAASTAAATPSPTPTAPAPSYSWSAEKGADGAITFAGSVPNPGFKSFMVIHAGGKATDATAVVPGAPKSFVGGALYGLDALMALDQGKLAFADGVWSLTGTVKDADIGKSAAAALGKIVDTKDWKIDIATAAPNPPATPAVAETPVKPAVVAPVPKPAAPAPAPYVFSASKAGGGAIVLKGDVPTEGAKGYFGGIVGNVPTDGLKIVSGAPSDFITNALAGLDVLGQLTDGELSYDGTKWSLKGKSATVDGRTAAIARVAALPAGKSWVTDVAGPSDVEICTAKVAAWAGANAINFDTRTTRFVKGTDAMLDSLAADLATCPDTRVDVEGNTDSDGDANANMALSVARAEAVVDALVKRGIKAERLYAVGYGETLPLVPNTTKANKAKNRRIVFSILDAHQK